MGKPHGIEHFSRYFKEFSNNYTIIGGSAASTLLEDQGLNFRKTVDLDIVLLINSSKDFNRKMAEYLEEGAYQIKEATEDSPKYYRFSNPQKEEFPKIIEIFAHNESNLDLFRGQYIIPIQNDSFVRISAILLDDDYFKIIRECATKSLEDYSVLNPIGIICLKGKAFRELTERKEDSKKIKKHRSDIIKMVQLLNSNDQYLLTETPKKDMELLLESISLDLSSKEIKQITEGLLSDKGDVIKILKRTFGI